MGMHRSHQGRHALGRVRAIVQLRLRPSFSPCSSKLGHYGLSGQIGLRKVVVGVPNVLGRVDVGGLFSNVFRMIAPPVPGGDLIRDLAGERSSILIVAIG